MFCLGLAYVQQQSSLAVALILAAKCSDFADTAVFPISIFQEIYEASSGIRLPDIDICHYCTPHNHIPEFLWNVYSVGFLCIEQEVSV